jgi:hypothetical protein
MADKPIIFSAPMVRALLDGRKTQTRRLLGPSNTLFNGRPWTKLHKTQVWAWEDAWVDPGPSPAGNPGPYLKLPWASGHEVFEDTVHRVYPMIQPGDRLYVREAFCPRLGYPAPIAKPHYRADDDKPEWRRLWKPSIHMPRWASRLTLTVTDVQVQRLQEISKEDAVAEGIEPYCGIDPDCHGYMNYFTRSEDGYWVPPRQSFHTLWNSLHGPDAWDANPWVVALTFDVRRGNIDAMPAIAERRRDAVQDRG